MDGSLNFREILSRKPWYEVAPDGYVKKGDIKFTDITTQKEPDDEVTKIIKTQADFLREYYPSGHSIFDTTLFPDIIKKDPDTGKWYIQPITRYAVAFQQVIALKHTTHLVGNDMQFELTGRTEDIGQEENKVRKLLDIQQWWLDEDMETRMYEAINSLQITADAAIIGYVSDGKVHTRTLSYLNGDKLYPHYNSITGALELFARQYNDYDEEGKTVTRWAEVWDDTYLYRAKLDGKTTFATRIKDFFGMGGYKVVSKEKHGFPFIPVAYTRTEGPAWMMVQKNIEDYEEAFSYLAENNKAYGFPIFYVNGNGGEVDIHGDINGAVKSITLSDKDARAGFLNPEDASAAFNAQLEKSYQLIYELSFTVQPPELKSGDLPGVAVKLLFSPAIECAINDAIKLTPFINDVLRIVRYGCGYAHNNLTDYMNLPFHAWIEPYIHQNDTELTTNLATAVQNKFLSAQTASERLKKYAMNDEYDRIIREDIDKRKKDLQDAIEKKRNDVTEDIRKEKAVAKINASEGGQDVNTGQGTRQRTTDRWGNHPNENNWDDWNKSH